MGCGASADQKPPPMTEEHTKIMAQDCCRRMEVVVVCLAFHDDGRDIKIQPPPCVQDMRDNVTEFKKLADEVSNAGDSQKPASSMLGSVMNAATSAAGAVAGGAVAAAVDALDQAVTAFETPFRTIARDIIGKKKEEMINIYISFILGYEFVDPLKMIRGDNPADPVESYPRAKKDGISSWLARAAGKQIAKKIHPVAEEEIKNHTVTKCWNTLNEAYNMTHQAFSKTFTDLDSRGIKKLTLDLDEYITEQIVIEIQKIMGREEARIRGDPAGQDNVKRGNYQPKPRSFALMFSSRELWDQDYTDWENGK